MRVTKKIRSDIEVINTLQKITEFKNNKNSREKNPRTILLQKITSNDNNNPIKVQLLKTKNNINFDKDLINMNSNSLSLNKNKNKHFSNDYYNNNNYCSNNTSNNNNIYEYQDNNLKQLKKSLILNNKNRVISESPMTNNMKYQNATYKSINQSPIKNTSDKSLNLFQNVKEHKIRNLLSKNLAYNKKKPSSTVGSPFIGMSGNHHNFGFKYSRKNSSESNNSLNDNNNLNNNNKDYGTKTYFGKERDNFSVSSYENNHNSNINSPKISSKVTDIDSNNVYNDRNYNIYNGNNNDNINIMNNMNNIYQNNFLIDIKLEDLIIFEERLNDIIIGINQGNSNNKNNNNKYDIGASNECYEFFSFYFHSSLKYKFPLFFHEPNKIIIQSAINLKLFIIMITYHLSLNPTMILKLLEDLKLIYSLLKQNLYLLIKKLNIFYGEASILKNEIYFRTFNYILSKNGINNLNENEIKDLINKNCCIIVKYFSSVIDYYKEMGNPFYLDFLELFKNLSKISENDINNYFCTYLLRKKKPKNPFFVNHNNNLNNIKVNNNSPKFKINNNANYNRNENILQIAEYKKNKKDAPYIKEPSTKKYTLVLDLDNTLISHNDNTTNEMCNLRPGLLSFLNTLKPIYELISFTNESKEYSDQLLSQIESSRKYFDYNLYREHNILIDNTLVKDISKIGRDMKKIIIVDKSSDNIKMTPQNGILIKPYFGESNANDTVLFELKKLLVLFHKMGYEDLRIAIKNYANDIKYKITLDNNN